MIIVIIINKVSMEEVRSKAKRNTPQKKTVLDIVLSSCDHPTADMIHTRAKKILPSISLGTVYRILGELTSEGKIRHITIDGGESRYDKTLFFHAHYRCRLCGKVEDVMTNCESILDYVNSQCGSVENGSFTFEGICKECGEKNN